MGDLVPIKGDKNASKGLTPRIPAVIHSAATEPEEPQSDADQIIVRNFLTTLAEIALSIVSRRREQERADGDPD